MFITDMRPEGRGEMDQISAVNKGGEARSFGP